MGFFQDLKEDLSQAVSEMVTDEAEEAAAGQQPEGWDARQAESDLAEIEAMLREKEAADRAAAESAGRAGFPARGFGVGEWDKRVKNADVPGNGAPTAEMIRPEVPAAGGDAGKVADTPIEGSENESAQESGNESAKDNTKESRDKKLDMKGIFNQAASDEVSSITEGMTIAGDVSSQGSLDLLGCVKGNINILGKLSVTGVIEGNSQASEIYANGARITGELRSQGSVKVGQDTVIVGNIFATSAVIAGAFKGDIDVQGPVVLDTSAIVMGNIKSKSVQINNGAVIEGMCSQCYADVNPISFFDEVKKAGRG